MNDGQEYIRWFSDPDAVDLARVGGKGANLARLTAAGFPVPPGFCVTAIAYRDFIASGDLRDLILAEVDRASTEGRGSTGSAVRRAIREQPIPESIARPIRAAYGEMGPSTRVAVRSSATAEDLPEASFAGQQDTYLNVRGEAELLGHVRRCWASLWTDRAIAYRQAHGFSHGDVLLAVVVQEMIESETAGVMFTANPVNGRRDETVVNASFGLGEAVVSGLVTPDTFIVDTRAGRVTQREIARKGTEITYHQDGLVAERAITGERATEPSLSDDRVVELAELGAQVQRYYGSPQDIEWGRRDGRFFLLQARPITTLGSAPDADPRDHWTRAMFVELLPDAPSPAFCSVLVPLLSNMLDFTFRALGQRPPSDIQAVAVFYSQPYFNLRYIQTALAGLPDATAARLTSRIANPFALTEDHGTTLSLGDLRVALGMLRAMRQLPDELPAVVEHYYAALDVHRRGDVALMTDEELARGVEAIALDVLPPLVDYDFLLIGALGFAERILHAMVVRSTLPEPDRVQAALISGLTGNLTMQTNKELWRLAQVAADHPEVAAVIGAPPAETMLDRLAVAEGGDEFLLALDAFLAEFGHREVRMDIAWPTWGEDPTPVLQFVRSYLAAGDAPDPSVQEQALADERRRATASVEAALGRSAAGRTLYRSIFRWALRHAEALGSERDSMHFHWTASFPVLRHLLETLGARWSAEGRIEATADIYCLPLESILRLATEGGDAREEVARRRQEWERNSRRVWPMEIRKGEEIYDDHEAAREGDDTDTLRGVPGSPGTITGVARVIRGPDEFPRLQPGEILVAPLTNPVWTPLFAVASALVTDAGGILSHGAIVAREYGIPAVMGVRGATSALSDGQRVTVDGVRGTVVLEAGSDA